MSYIVTNQQMKAVECLADRMGVSYFEMMDNAGNAVAECAAAIIPPKSIVYLLCGSGNNGGDGFVAAQRLCALGYDARVILVNGEPRTDCARAHFERMPRSLCAQDFSENGAVIDCVFGTGFHGTLPENVKNILKKTANFPVRIAVDVPSGVNSDTGECAEGCFVPTHTFVLAAVKRGFLVPQCMDMLGEVQLLDIGIPDSAFAEYSAKITNRQLLRVFPARNKSSHKGSFGRLLNISGSLCYSGAAVMSTLAALRSGTGLCTLACPKSVVGIAAAAVPETTFLPLPENEDGFIAQNAVEKIAQALPKATAVLVGCGLGSSPAARAVTEYVIKNANCPIIIDADGINSICENINILTQRADGQETILTPHPLEFSRISGIPVRQIQSDRITAATAFARKFNVTLVLKGAGTVVASKEETYVNLCGNAGLAKGGSGDALAGIIAALCAQGASAANAAACGVYCHARSADILLDELPMQSMLTRDIISALPQAFR